MELSNYLVSWVVTYLGDLQPTLIGLMIELLSSMDIPVGLVTNHTTSLLGKRCCDDQSWVVDGAIFHHEEPVKLGVGAHRVPSVPKKMITIT